MRGVSLYWPSSFQAWRGSQTFEQRCSALTFPLPAIIVVTRDETERSMYISTHGFLACAALAVAVLSILLNQRSLRVLCCVFYCFAEDPITVNPPLNMRTLERPIVTTTSLFRLMFIMLMCV